MGEELKERHLSRRISGSLSYMSDIRIHDELDELDERFDLKKADDVPSPHSNEYLNKVKAQLDVSRDHHNAFEDEALIHATDLKKLESDTPMVKVNQQYLDIKPLVVSPTSVSRYRNLHDEYQRSVHVRMDQDVVKNKLTDQTFQPLQAPLTPINTKDAIPITVSEALKGLSDNKVLELRGLYGLNEITEKKTNPVIKFLMYFTGSIAFLIEIAIILSAVLKDWIDFGVILGLLLINAIIGFVEEQRAESAVDALKNTLALRSKVIRSGKLTEIESKYLVPGDVIDLRMGEIIPADALLLCVTSKGQESKVGLSKTNQD
jgi:hypothetical protein